MKKIGLLTFLTIFIFSVGCSPEKEKQIKTYWETQEQLFMQRLSPKAQIFLSQQHARFDASRLRSSQQKEEITKPTQQIEKTPAQPPKPLEAKLFVASSCPWCQRMIREGVPEKFRAKYEAKVILKEYTIDTFENEKMYLKLINKFDLPNNVPLLVIGDTPVQGYSETLWEQIVAATDKEIKKHHLENYQPEALKTPPVLQVSMEDEEILGPASAEDKRAMKRMLLSFQEMNEETIKSIGFTFGPVVKNKAMALVAQAEKNLKFVADKSSDLTSFTSQYNQITAKHDETINQLMRDNADKLRNVR